MEENCLCGSVFFLTISIPNWTRILLLSVLLLNKMSDKGEWIAYILWWSRSIQTTIWVCEWAEWWIWSLFVWRSVCLSLCCTPFIEMFVALRKWCEWSFTDLWCLECILIGLAWFLPFLRLFLRWCSQMTEVA